jgi:formylglycine-generating enzyme required for sulfatase activity
MMGFIDYPGYRARFGLLARLVFPLVVAAASACSGSKSQIGFETPTEAVPGPATSQSDGAPESDDAVASAGNSDREFTTQDASVNAGPDAGRTADAGGEGGRVLTTAPDGGVDAMRDAGKGGVDAMADTSTGEVDAMGDAGTGGVDATGDVDAMADTGTGVVIGPNGCPEQMVAISDPAGGQYCVDSFEVTNAQYAAFLAHTGSQQLRAQPASCSWNNTFQPYAANASCEGRYDPAGHGDMPVVCVDWCDAHAYCQWAGKRLCGRIGGGANPYNDLLNANEDQWYRACSAAGTRYYPYGNSYEAAACNGPDYGSGAPIAVGTATACVASTPGLYDMSGNVGEWEDVCDANAGTYDDCSIKGGQFDSSTSGLMRCDSISLSTRVSAQADVGFRCCWDDLPGNDDAGDAQDATDANEDGSVDAPADAPTDAPTEDARDATGSVDAAPAASVSIPGPEGGTYYVDATETTNAEYAQFLAYVKGGGSVTQPAECSWNDSFDPAAVSTDCAPYYDPVGRANYPVVCVDWCDAREYCLWVGKRLCGAIGGGSVSRADAADPATDQWYRACSLAGTLTYPYGNVFDATACNGGDSGYGATTPVGSISTCEGGYPGLFDMSGNVSEWSDTCDSTTGLDDQCLTRGGRYDNPSLLWCGLIESTFRADAFRNIGFRCCSD